jgi:hypothetical protein
MSKSTAVKMARTPQDLDQLAADLQVAWRKYEHFFGEPPHGTLKQIRGLLEFLPKDAASATPP